MLIVALLILHVFWTHGCPSLPFILLQLELKRSLYYCHFSIGVTNGIQVED